MHLQLPFWIIAGQKVQVNYIPPTVAFNLISSSGAESISSVNLQVSLSALTEFDVTVDYTVSGTATGSGTDYTLTDGTLTIEAGNTSANISIANIVDDTLIESNETIILTLLNPSQATLGTNTVHTYTINDNDVESSDSDIYKNNVTVYPNPCTDNIYINNISSDISYFIINDLSGKTVLITDYNVEKNINVSYLKPGIYLLIIVNSNSERQIVKIVKE